MEKGSLWLLPVPRGSTPAVQQTVGEGQRAVWLCTYLDERVYTQHVGNGVTLLGNPPTLLPVRKMDQESFTDFVEENAEPFSALPTPQPLFNVFPCSQHQHRIRQLLEVFYKFWTLTEEVYWWHNCFSLLADFKLAFKLLPVFSWFFLCLLEESCFYTPGFLLCYEKYLSCSVTIFWLITVSLIVFINVHCLAALYQTQRGG